MCMMVFSQTAHADAVPMNTGLYVSNEMGEDNAHFLELTAIDVYIPENSSINFYFTGNQSNFETWSGPLSLSDGRIDLNSVGEITKSDRVKFKIQLESTSQYTPVIKGYRITYDIGGQTSTIEENVNMNSMMVGDNEIGASSDISSINSLASTGTNIWFYLLLALVASTIVGYLIMREKKT